MDARVGRPSEKRLVSASRISFRRPPDGCVPLKTCTKCKIEKPKTEFTKRSKSKDGLVYKCRSCTAEYSKMFYAENKEKRNLASMRWQKNNPEKVKQYKMKHLTEKSEQVYAVNKAWRIANKELMANAGRAWRAANPGKATEIARNRRAKKRNADGIHTVEDVNSIFENQRGKCANCNKKLIKTGKEKYHVDHITPLAKGGTNWPSNLQCLCPDCNLRKAAKNPLDWAKENGKLL